jgi:hypothetical protein
MGEFNINLVELNNPIFGNTATLGAPANTNPVLLSAGSSFYSTAGGAGVNMGIINGAAGADGDVSQQFAGFQPYVINQPKAQNLTTGGHTGIGAVRYGPVGFAPGQDKPNTGGGVGWTKITGLTDGTPVAQRGIQGEFNISSATVALQNQSGQNETLTSGVGYAFSGPVPTGSNEAEWAISASYTLNNGARTIMDPIVFAVGGPTSIVQTFVGAYQENGATGVTTAIPGGRVNFTAPPVQQNGFDKTKYQSNSRAAVNNAFGDFVGIQEYMDPASGVMKFSAYAIAQGAQVQFNANDKASATVTMTMLADPDAEIDLDDISDDLPIDLLPDLPNLSNDDMGDTQSLPEPASLSLLALAAGAMIRRRR